MCPTVIGWGETGCILFKKRIKSSPRHLCNDVSPPYMWNSGSVAAVKIEEAPVWIQEETAWSHSVTYQRTTPSAASKQRCRGHQDCWVIELVWAALSSTSAKNTSHTVTGHRVKENDCSCCRNTGQSHHQWPSVSKAAIKKKKKERRLWLQSHRKPSKTKNGSFDNATRNQRAAD